MSLSLIALAEIIRDFHQYIYIIVSGLDNHISKVTKVSFIQVQNWISLDLYKTLGIRVSLTMFGQLLLLIICSFYLFTLTYQSLRKNHHGLDGQTYAETSTFMKMFNLLTIFIITTLFQPIMNNSLQIWFNTLESSQKDEEIILKIISTISLFIILILIPLIFIRGIKYTRPALNKYDKRGGQLIEMRQIYEENLQKTQSPFKPIFREYSYGGAYFKLVIMLYKFVQLVLLINKPNPYKNQLQFIIQYSLFGGISLILFVYIYRSKPYLNDRLNTLYMASILTSVICLGCNVGLFFLDDKEANKKQIQFIFSIAQISACLVIFLFNYFIVILTNFPFVVRMIQKFNNQLLFTDIRKRGKSFSNIIGLNQNPYFKYVVFNPNIYNKETEICINIWQDFWLNIIQKDPKFKSSVKLNDLVFINPGNAPPYLKKFCGSVEERFEENIRILQQVGIQQYQEELNNLENPEYQKLILYIYRDISPLDSYYETKDKQLSGFCKVVFYPFPMMLQIMFDGQDKVFEISGYEALDDFYQQNMQPDILEMKSLRQKLRALNGQIVDYTYVVKSNLQKGQQSAIKDISKSIDIEITYTFGKFIFETDAPTYFKVPNGPTIDVGKGMNCYLIFKNGIGQSLDGQVYRAPTLTLNNKDLQMDCISDQESIINQIIQKNESIWKRKQRKLQDHLEKYKMSKVGDFLLKKKVLSYGFNLNIFQAPYDYVMEIDHMFKELRKEMNFDLEMMYEKEKYKFEALYETLHQSDENDLFAYLYILFKDIWKHNQDISIIKKNDELINPDKKTCLIYMQDKTLADWKEILLEQGLRSSDGKGYFNDDIFENIINMVKNMKDVPKDFIQQSFPLLLNDDDLSLYQKNSIYNKNNDIENHIQSEDHSLQFNYNRRNIPKYNSIYQYNHNHNNNNINNNDDDGIYIKPINKFMIQKQKPYENSTADNSSYQQSQLQLRSEITLKSHDGKELKSALQRREMQLEQKQSNLHIPIRKKRVSIDLNDQSQKSSSMTKPKQKLITDSNDSTAIQSNLQKQYKGKIDFYEIENLQNVSIQQKIAALNNFQIQQKDTPIKNSQIELKDTPIKNNQIQLKDTPNKDGQIQQKDIPIKDEKDSNNLPINQNDVSKKQRGKIDIYEIENLQNVSIQQKIEAIKNDQIQQKSTPIKNDQIQQINIIKSQEIKNEKQNDEIVLKKVKQLENKSKLQENRPPLSNITNQILKKPLQIDISKDELLGLSQSSKSSSSNGKGQGTQTIIKMQYDDSKQVPKYSLNSLPIHENIPNIKVNNQSNKILEFNKNYDQSEYKSSLKLNILDNSITKSQSYIKEQSQY